MSPAQALILWTVDPATLIDLDNAAWERALMLGRRHGLSGRWYPALEALGALSRLPPPVQRHLHSDYLVAADRMRSARWEINRLRHALASIGIEPVLLKGAAYIAAGLAAGHCRMLTDVDCLVPFAALEAVEAALEAHGWHPMPKDEYDERYYREWMHELPPFQHAIRGSSLDLHHNILPRTSALCPDAELLLARARRLADGCRVLDPADMVMHSVLHGFFGGELTNCFRDVLDVYELCRDFVREDPGFWEALSDRALALRAARPTWLALRQLRRLPGPGVPDAVLDRLARAAGLWPARPFVERAIDTAFVPSAPPTAAERLALKFLLARAHLCKMPLRLLAPHLAHKLSLRWRGRQAAETSVKA
ncbi:MAG TPA: nucleotidyltransferase family protein [Gammaproteobacteria bacterium]|nr:nucleotidyltransferase family protein [Gammaproteobacteria bacterium]